ncbi:Uncharacterised protein [Mycobacterium tuberculosis]|nr:Uncharacterised protein [Mycobacterium tuberculosis]
MVAALEDAEPRGRKVRGGAVERDAQLVPALGYSNRLLILEVSCLVAIVGIERQVIDGVFLALGPQALASHVATHG